jgi:heme-degrading monooxygenase HmoA
MFASFTSVGGAGAEVGATARMAGESMASWLRDFDGYRGILILADEEAGRARIVTFWDSMEAIERSERGRTQVRESMVAAAGAEVEAVERLAVVFEDRVEPASGGEPEPSA